MKNDDTGGFIGGISVAIGFIDIVIVSTVVQLSIFGLFLAARGLGKRRELLFLSLFFLSFVLYILNQFVLRHLNDLEWQYMHLLYLGAPFGFLYAPCFYLYLRRSRQGNLRPWPLTLLHFVPFLLLSGYLLLVFYFREAGDKLSILRDPTFLLNSASVWYTVTVLAQFLFYLALGLRRLVRYRRRHGKAGLAHRAADDAWIMKLGAGLAVLWLLDLLRFASRLSGLLADRVTGNLSSNPLQVVFETALYLCFALFGYFILFSALRRPQTVLGGEEEAARQKKSLSERTAASYKQELLHVMEKRKPHLEPELSLSDLSCLTGIPSRSLSEVIRKCDSDNFYDFVNEYRVKEFIRFLADPGMNHQTVLTLMFEAGFNSKSVFNKAFKKKTGKNPRLFMKQRKPGE